MTFAYLGPAGTFTEQAARLFAGGAAALTPTQTIEQVFAAVAGGVAERGVVPIENAIEGAVNATVDALIFDAALYIRRRRSLPITHQLMAANGSAAVTKILSHPQALAQCRKFLSAHYPNAAQEAAASTAEAARLAAGTPGAAAIAARAAAELYGLEILREDIQDADGNATQFILIGREDTAEPRDGCITSLAFETGNRPGGLAQVLDIFSVLDINLTKILSRPVKATGGRYVFYIDVECDGNAADVADALRIVERKTIFYKPLGSYPSD